MIRDTGRPGDILKITVPVETTGMFRTFRCNIKLDILIEKVSDGRVTLVVENPHLEDAA